MKNIIELETNEFGRVITQNDLIQIKIWKHINEVSKLVGTITFRCLEYKFNFKGIVNKKNSKMILDMWFYTGMSNYLVQKVGKERLLKFSIGKYFGFQYLPVIERYKQFIRDYPEYQHLKLI
jgi:hypothetical protein